MKKIVCLLLFATLLISTLVACGKSNNSGVIYEQQGNADPQSNPVSQPSIQYISDRRTQYDEAKKQYIVFFGLKTADGTYVDSSGNAKIVITDESGYTLFDKQIAFTPSDFTEWTNQTWDGPRYMCGLYINQADIEGSSSTSGNLTLEVTLEDGTYFSAETVSISNLPSLQVNITMPSLPATYQDEGYSYTSTVTVTKLEYSSKSNYDGKSTVEFTVLLRLDGKTGQTNESSSVQIGYKLFDEDGVVVDSGNIYSDPIAIGEVSRGTFTIFDLDPRQNYTLTFMNAS